MERREQIARIINPEGFVQRDHCLAKAAEWDAKTAKFAATEDPRRYPDGQLAIDRIVKSWGELADRFRNDADRAVIIAYKKADEIIALD